jgi:hypothetical protein
MPTPEGDGMPRTGNLLVFRYPLKGQRPPIRRPPLRAMPRCPKLVRSTGSLHPGKITGMSSNPFGDVPNTNPYAPPTPGAGELSPNNPLQAPAIILLVLSSLFVLFILASFPNQIATMREVDTSTTNGIIELVTQVLMLVLLLAINVAIARGAISMLRLKNYRRAHRAAIFSLIPICTPCFLLGIPFGIWALVLLNRPEVKQRFRG